MSRRKYIQECREVSKLRHKKNEFESDHYELIEYPVIHKDIQFQLNSIGYELLPNKERSSFLLIPPMVFEIQTHNRSVDEHTDDSPRGVLFGIYPVKQKNIGVSFYNTMTELRGFFQGRKFKEKLSVGKLVVFNPIQTHSLIYYGEETTYMMFSVRKKRL